MLVKIAYLGFREGRRHAFGVLPEKFVLAPTSPVTALIRWDEKAGLRGMH